MNQFTVQSVRGITHYWVNENAGKDDPCIVFTHGMTADHTMFDKQIEFFKDNYKVITWDVPMHGKSRPYKKFTYHNASQELKSILEAEDVKHAVLVGQSMGGYICQEFAVQFPEIVTAFVAVDSTPFGHFYYSKWERFILSKAANMASWWPYKLLIKSMAKNATRTKYAYENLYQSVSNLSKKEIIQIMSLVFNEFLKQKDTVKFEFPVLLIIGDSDKTGYVKKYNKSWEQHTGYPLIVISNAAHNSNVDNYQEFNRVVNTFLKGL